VPAVFQLKLNFNLQPAKYTCRFAFGSERYSFPFLAAINLRTTRQSVCHLLASYSMDDTNNESLNHGLTGTDEQFHSQDPVVDVNNAQSSVPPLTEMLALVSEPRELTQNL